MKCAVKNCKNNNYLKPATISFFSFPSDNNLLKQWKKFCCRDDPFNEKTARICMEHFKPLDFENDSQFEMGFTKRRYLKHGSVPTIQKISRVNEERYKERAQRIHNRENKKIVELLIKEHDAPSVLANGIKTALVRMVKLQEDGNEIQTERLAIERERLQYERTVADRFLNIMEQNQKIQQQLQQQLLHQQQLFQQQQQHIQIQQRSVTAPQVFATNSGQATVTSNGQIMLPPKLLITTMVPTSTAQAAAASTSKVLTTTSFSNLASTSNSDFQLVVPKEEPKN